MLNVKRRREKRGTNYVKYRIVIFRRWKIILCRVSWTDVNEHFILVATTQEHLERRPVTQLYLISAILDTISLHLPHGPFAGRRPH